MESLENLGRQHILKQSGDKLDRFYYIKLERNPLEVVWFITVTVLSLTGPAILLR